MVTQAQWQVVTTKVRTVPRDIWVTLGVLVVALLLRLNHLDVVVDNYDEGVYVASLRSLVAGHTLYAQVYQAQPPLFLYLLLPWYLLFGQTIAAARLGVVIYSVMGLVAMWWLGRDLGGLRVGLIALALLGFDPLYLTQSRVVLAEAPALAFAILAVALAAGARRRQDDRRAALAGAFFLMSMLIKLFTLPALIPIVVFLLQPTAWPTLIKTAITTRRLPTRAACAAAWQSSQRAIIAFVAGMAVVAAITLVLIGNALGPAWSQMVGLHIAATGAFAAVRSNNLALFTGLGLEYVLIIPGLVAGVIAWQRRQWSAVVIVVWGLASAFVLAIQTPLFDHHLTLLIPPFALATALLPLLVETAPSANTPTPGKTTAAKSAKLPAAPTLVAWGRQIAVDRVVQQYVTASALALILVVGLAHSVVQENDAVHNPPIGLEVAAHDLHDLTPASGLVITDDQTVADLADRDVPAAVVDTSNVRITSGQLTTQQVIAAASDPRVVAILWYSGRFNELPGLHDWVTQHFVRVIAYDTGDLRGLYLRRPPSQPIG
jgi:4-amino-4-deoxy-L-arabinose transferase-like glycosyltransferase